MRGEEVGKRATAEVADRRSRGGGGREGEGGRGGGRRREADGRILGHNLTMERWRIRREAAQR